CRARSATVSRYACCPSPMMSMISCRYSIVWRTKSKVRETVKRGTLAARALIDQSHSPPDLCYIGSMDVSLNGRPAGPCSGISVLDFSTVISGPMCTMILGDLGADVVKVEPPRGDATRMMGPPFKGGLSALFVHFNRNKRSLVLDLKRREGQAVAQRLAG